MVTLPLVERKKRSPSSNLGIQQQLLLQVEKFVQLEEDQQEEEQQALLPATHAPSAASATLTSTPRTTGEWWRSRANRLWLWAST